MSIKLIEFSTEEKIENFEKISQYFFQSNFGEMSKSDIELLMFSFYLDNIIAHSTDKNGVLNYSACSDYNISKDLGITQQRVRNLKIKKAVKTSSRI